MLGELYRGYHGQVPTREEFSSKVREVLPEVSPERIEAVIAHLVERGELVFVEKLKG